MRYFIFQVFEREGVHKSLLWKLLLKKGLSYIKSPTIIVIYPAVDDAYNSSKATLITLPIMIMAHLGTAIYNYFHDSHLLDKSLSA